MALLDGKQLRDDSLSLDKLSGNSGLVTFTSSATMSFGAGTSLTTDDSNIVSGLDVVNKNYVDAVAVGLNTKAASRVIFTEDVTLVAGYTYSNGASGIGATLTFTVGSMSSIDGTSLSSGDRVIFNSTTDRFVNGVYVYGTTASFFTRATDFDGYTTQEVDGGEYSFVTEGTTYADTGWVVSEPNSTATIGVTEIVWVQFSSAGVITAGDGLTQVGNNFNVGAGTGLTVSSSQVSIADTTVTANSYGGAGTVPTFTVNGQGQLTAATDVAISITASQVSDFNTAASTEIFDSGNFVDGTTVDFTVTAGTSVTAEVTTGSLTASHLNSNGGATAGYILSAAADGTFDWIINDAGDITGITAGAGLTGGGSSGAITLDVNVENGIEISSDYVGLGGTLVRNTTIDGDGFDLTLGNVDYMLFTASSAFDVETNFVSLDSGTGSTQILSGGDTSLSAGGDLDLLATGGVYVVGASFSVNSVEIDPTSPTTGYVLTYDGTKFTPQAVAGTGDITEVIAGAGISGGATQGSAQLDIELSANSGLTFSVSGDSGTLEVAVDNTTIQIVDGQLVATTQGDITDVTAGAGLTGGGSTGAVTLDVGAGDGITVNADDVAVNLASNSGLSFTSGQLTVDSTIAGAGLSWSAGVLSLNPTASAVPYYGDRNLKPSTTAPNADNVTSGLTIANTPSDYSRVNVYVNGQLQYLGNGTSSNVDCYFGTQSGTAVAITDIQSGYTLFWNGSNSGAGFRLTTSDKVDIIYEV